VKKKLVLFAMFTVLAGCSGGGAGSSTGSISPAALNLAGAWTVTTVSTQGHGSFSGTATVSQSGAGLGVNGTTTIEDTLGQITVSQTGTALTGTLTNSVHQAITFNFIGALSSGNFTITGSTPCPSSSATQSTSLTGTLTSSSAQGTYTITRGSGCYYPSDAGTFVATK
jgi:hypothetical protein